MYSPAYALKKQSEQAPFALTDAPVGNSDLSMDDLFLKQLALKLCGEAYRYHMQGDLGQRSTSMPSRSTLSTLSYSRGLYFQPRPILFAAAPINSSAVSTILAEFHRAVETDRSFGNPY
jgi:hypothetical protein